MLTSAGYRRRIARLALLLGTALLALVAVSAEGAPRQDTPLIAFSGARGGDVYSVSTIRPDGTGRRSLGAASFLAAGMRPAWSRDGRRVAFSGLDGLAVAGALGAGRRELGEGFDDNIGEGASWSPDARTIVVPAELNLWLFDVGSGRATKLAAQGQRPSFSPDGKTIAFVAPGLSLMNADGTRVRVVVDMARPADEREPSAPSWSPDGRRVVFERAGDVVVYDLRRRRVTRLTRGPRIDREPVWSPDGRWIAFVRGQPVSTRDTDTGVSIIRPDGSGLRTLTEVPFVEIGPTWSSDSRRIAFLGGEHEVYGATAAYVVAIRGGPARRLFRPACSAEQISGLTWGRGGRLAFATFLRPNDSQIYVSRTDGTGVHRLATSCAEETDPSWSPDGRRLAYARGDSVYVMRADGSRKRRVTAGGDPDWSPDGRKLVLARGGRLSQIFTAPAAGGPARRLTSAGSNSTPSWSSASGRVAFTSTRDGRDEVYTMRPDGSDQRRFTELGGSEPSWSPDGRRIAFVYGPNVWTIRADGSAPAAVTHYDEYTRVLRPAWSRDGRTIAFTYFSDDEETGGIAFASVADGALTFMPYSPFVGALGHTHAVFSSSPDWYPG